MQGFGPGAPFKGDASKLRLPSPIGGISSSALFNNEGYYLFDGAGDVYCFGFAQLHGDRKGEPMAGPVVGMAHTQAGGGYWLFAGDGGVFSFGDAPFLGSLGGRPLAAPVVGGASTTSGHGYWLVGADGGVFAFGDANFYGSAAETPLRSPIVGILPCRGPGSFSTANRALAQAVAR